jgi:hypothetical protein
MNRENTFHANSVGNFPHGEVRAVSSAGKTDDRSLENLGSFFFARHDFNVDPDGFPGS